MEFNSAFKGLKDLKSLQHVSILRSSSGSSLFLDKVTCDFIKEQCSSLKMISGSKHGGAILNVLM